MIVKRIQERRGMVLVEWTENNTLHRSLLPSEEVTPEGECANPERGMDYGVPWSEYFSYQFDAEAIEAILHNAGVWTLEDLERNAKVVQGAMVQIAGDILQNLLRNVKLGSNVVNSAEEELTNEWSNL